MKRIISILISAILIFGLTACNSSDTVSEENGGNNIQKTANVLVLSGPTGIGAAKFKSDAESGEASGKYNVNIVATPDEIVAKISNGEADIAAVATNLAAKLYNKTNGGITTLAVNTLGVLDVVAPAGTEISDFKELSGQKIYSTGQGSNPEYIINDLLEKNGIKDKVTIEYKADGNELLTVWATVPDAVIIAPQPVATVLTVKYPDSKIALDLTDEWEKVNKDSSLMMGCVIVRNEFLQKNKSAVDLFLKEYEKSINFAHTNTEDTAVLCEKYGLISSAAVAKSAIPYCNIYYIDGAEMKTKLSGYLEALYNADKASVGGALPSGDFYYEK